jgi:hypothetical protein
MDRPGRRSQGDAGQRPDSRSQGPSEPSWHLGEGMLGAGLSSCVALAKGVSLQTRVVGVS